MYKTVKSPPLNDIRLRGGGLADKPTGPSDYAEGDIHHIREARLALLG